MTTYNDLLDEIQRGQSTLLSSARVGESMHQRIIVQRSDGSIWEAFDLFTVGADEATPWSLRASKWAYWKGERLFPEMDCEALFRFVNWREAQDEMGAAVEAAMYLTRSPR